MTENIMCPAHKSSNKNFREGWERTFGKKKQTQEELELLNDACKPNACEENNVIGTVVLNGHNKDCSCDGCKWMKQEEVDKVRFDMEEDSKLDFSKDAREKAKKAFPEFGDLLIAAVAAVIKDESPQEEVDRLSDKLKAEHKLIKKFIKHSKELGW